MPNVSPGGAVLDAPLHSPRVRTGTPTEDQLLFLMRNTATKHAVADFARKSIRYATKNFTYLAWLILWVENFWIWVRITEFWGREHYPASQEFIAEKLSLAYSLFSWKKCLFLLLNQRVKKFSLSVVSMVYLGHFQDLINQDQVPGVVEKFQFWRSCRNPLCFGYAGELSPRAYWQHPSMLDKRLRQLGE